VANACESITVADSDTVIAGYTTDTVDVVCNDGYSGDATVTCEAQSDSETPAFTSATCEANPCVATSVANSDKKDAGSIVGYTTEIVQVVCDSGYSGSGDVVCEAVQDQDTPVFTSVTCSNVNECLDDPCHAQASCADTVGSYTCTCNDGYSGDGWSCEANACEPITVENSDTVIEATTTQTVGVVCNDGYDGDSTVSCDAINGEETPQFTSAGTCTANACESITVANSDTVIAGFTTDTVDVVCNTGYAGDGTVSCDAVEGENVPVFTTVECTNVNECDSNPCDSNAQCTDTDGSYTCACNPGYSGDGHSCTICDFGYYAESVGSATCDSCDAGYYLDAEGS
jgi:hypothetical protein